MMASIRGRWCLWFAFGEVGGLHPRRRSWCVLCGFARLEAEAAKTL